MTTLFLDSVFERHETGAHPETPRRLRAIAGHAPFQAAAARCQKGTFNPAPLSAVHRVHNPEVAARAIAVCQAGGGYLDADTPVCPESVEVALAAAGAACAAVDAVLTRGGNALALVRPPGHHATPSHSMGFCLFNNIALAARHAQDRHGLRRILIVDWDVHHGNGTQDIFYTDGQVHFFSIHRFPFYPGTGRQDETGSGPGLGAIRNVPVRFGTPRERFLELFTQGLEEQARRCQPELIVLSAGFDAHADDPIGSLGLCVEDFGTMTERLLAVARVHCGGRVVSLLEGGYHLQRLAECVTLHLEKLLADGSAAGDSPVRLASEVSA